MELKTHHFRNVFTALYFVAFAIYIIVGLQPAAAESLEIDTTLSIPSIQLNSDVAIAELVDYQLKTPNTIVGSFSKNPNKTLLIGHSSTVFQNIHRVTIGDSIEYDHILYTINHIETLPKADISMNQVLKAESTPTIVLMTCAGMPLSNHDASHRLIITASIE